MSMAEEAEVSGHLDYAELALNNGDPASALMAVRDVLACAGRDSPSGSDVRARSLLASALEGTGDLVGAIAELESLVLVVPRDRHWVGLLMVLIRCLRESGDLAGARHTGHEALDEVERAGLADTPEAIRLALTVAGAHNSAGDNLEALRMSERAAERAEAIDSDLGRASAYWQLSVCHYRLGDLATSADLARAALAGFEKVPDPRSQAILRTNLAFTCMRLDHPDLGEAQHHLELAASELAWSPASVVERAGHLQATARLAYLRGDLPRARRSAEEGLTIAAGRSPRVAAACHLTLGQVSLREGDHEAAQDQFHRAVGLLASCGMDRDIAQAWYELGGVLDTVGDTAAALDAYRRAAVSTGQVTPQPSPAPV